MSDQKKKGNFPRTSGQPEEIGGNKNSHAKRDRDSRSAHKQNAGGGSRMPAPTNNLADPRAETIWRASQACFATG